jgi:arylsulfatase A-like enzyme
VRCAALLAALLGASSCGEERSSPDAPNIVLITVDTLRADHLGCYGHDRDTTPHVDALAADGVLYRNALAQASWTLPSLASLHSSLYPSEHNALGARSRLPEATVTLAEVLAAHGWRTLAVVSHVYAGSRHGMHQGFAEFHEENALWHEAVTSPMVTRDALELLGESSREPFFLWTHYFDPHTTFVPHQEFGFAEAPERFGDMRLSHRVLERVARSCTPEQLSYVEAIYDEEIAFTDEHVGRLVDSIRALELGRPTVFVFTADHGEYFMERGRFGHGEDVYQDLVHVPLILAGLPDEGLRGRVVEEVVEIASLPRTLTRLAGLEEAAFQGEDLLALDELASQSRPRFSEGMDAESASRRKHAVIDRGWKLIRHLDDGRLELYDLNGDPRETRDLSASEDARVVSVREALLAALEAYASREALERQEVQLDEDELDALRDLGYVE